MRPATARRAAALMTGAAVPLLLASPALAASFDGEVRGDNISVGTAVLLYVVLPIAIYAAIALLVLAPSLLRRPRYRPGRAWNHDPVWFAGPDDPEAALRDARPRATSRGGASADW